MPYFWIVLFAAVILIAVLAWAGRRRLPWLRMRAASPGRIQVEDALKHLFEASIYGRQPGLESLAGELSCSIDDAAHLLQSMEAQGWLSLADGQISLTPDGREYALHILRAHRIWERHLADETGFPDTEWHGKAEEQEHHLTPSEAEALYQRLGRPIYDPHGDPIPGSSGTLAPITGQSLATAPEGQRLRILHIEDEPEAVYAQLSAAGLHPGMELRLIEKSSARLTVWFDDQAQVLAPLLANNITVLALPEPSLAKEERLRPLSSLEMGQSGEVAGLTTSCTGPQRRRLLDLGVVPGTQIEAALRSPGGDPTAYKIRGALIALRREQADLITITSPSEVEA
jgi:DtxR family Mn-dependent transcriptional regulator